MKMRVLVQNCQNHRWLKAPREWTGDLEEARTFPSSESALRFCAEHKVRPVQIVLRFGSEKLDVKIPVSDECRESSHAA